MRSPHRAYLLLITACLLAPLRPCPALAESSEPSWQYTAMVDVAYLLNFNFPENHLWRSKTTTVRTNEFAPNMAFVSISKDVSVESPWGGALLIQTGYDTQGLVPDTIPGREKPIPGDDLLRRVGRANVSHRVPLGQGLLVTAGIFESYIGYESLYAKDNVNYTRSYMADHSPYIMMGISARYPFTDALTVGLFVVNGYTYLSHINPQPSYGTQLAWKIGPHVRIIENLYAGPDQAATDLRFWRYFSDSIVEWKKDRLTLATSYDIGTEQAALLPGHPQTLWMAGAVYSQYQLFGPWSLACRPEVYWDRNGRLTGAEQLLMAVTSTLEYQRREKAHTTRVRLEYRYDASRGPAGGFFHGATVSELGRPALVPAQHLLLLSLIWSYEGG